MTASLMIQLISVQTWKKGHRWQASLLKKKKCKKKSEGNPNTNFYHQTMEKRVKPNHSLDWHEVNMAFNAYHFTSITCGGHMNSADRA